MCAQLHNIGMWLCWRVDTHESCVAHAKGHVPTPAARPVVLWCCSAPRPPTPSGHTTSHQCHTHTHMAGGAVVLQRGDGDVRCAAGMPRLLSLAPAWEEEGGAGEGGGGGAVTVGLYVMSCGPLQ